MTLLLVPLGTRKVDRAAVLARQPLMLNEATVRHVERRGGMMPATVSEALVLPRLQRLRPGLVVPLGLAGDDRPTSQVAVSVEVLVALGRLPAEEPAQGDAGPARDL